MNPEFDFYVFDFDEGAKFLGTDDLGIAAWTAAELGAKKGARLVVSDPHGFARAGKADPFGLGPCEAPEWATGSNGDWYAPTPA